MIKTDDYKKLKPKQFQRLWRCTIFFLLLLIGCTMIMIATGKSYFIWGIATASIGVLSTIAITLKNAKTRKYSCLIEKFIRSNNLLQYHFTNRGKEKIDYYPNVEYKIEDNDLCIKWRLDGSAVAQKLRDIEQALADSMSTVCLDIIEERGYITYILELEQPKQAIIKSVDDLSVAREHEILISNIKWDWIKTPHLLLTGATRTGKTEMAKYIMLCMQWQGVRVYYFDPKNSTKMRRFCKKHSIPYVAKENDIARTVRELEEEMRLREEDLQNMGLKEAEFNPVYLFIDELIAYSKIATKKNFQEVSDRLASLIVMGAEKRIYVCTMLQRPDTKFIEGAIRDNLTCKICMGHMSEVAYKMVFGSDFSHIHNLRNEVGSGLIFRQGIDRKPREMLAPYICEGALD